MLSIRSCGANWNRLSLLNHAMVWNGRIPLLAQFSTSMASGEILMMRTPTMPKQQLPSIWYSCALRNSSSNPTTTSLDDLQEINEEGKAEPTNPSNLAENDLTKKKSVRYSQGQSPKWLTIKFQQGKSGQKFFSFNKNQQSAVGPTNIYNFPNVLVPEDVVGFVRAMDELLLGAVEVNRAKIEASRKQPGAVLHTANANGLRYDFQLDLCCGYNNNSLFVQMRTVPNGANPEHKPRSMDLPLRQFHWLRHRIGEMLAECGEGKLAEQLGKAPWLPVWIGRDNFRQSPPNNVRTQQQPPSHAQQQQPTQSQQSPAQLQQLLLQLVLQQQQQLQQMQAAPSGWPQNNGGFGGFPSSNVPQMDPTSVLLSSLLAQVQQQPAQTAPPIAQQQPMNEQLLAGLLQLLQTNQSNSGGQ